MGNGGKEGLLRGSATIKVSSPNRGHAWRYSFSLSSFGDQELALRQPPWYLIRSRPSKIILCKKDMRTTPESEDFGFSCNIHNIQNLDGYQSRCF